MSFRNRTAAGDRCLLIFGAFPGSAGGYIHRLTGDTRAGLWPVTVCWLWSSRGCLRTTYEVNFRRIAGFERPLKTDRSKFLTLRPNVASDKTSIAKKASWMKKLRDEYWQAPQTLNHSCDKALPPPNQRSVGQQSKTSKSLGLHHPNPQTSLAKGTKNNDVLFSQCSIMS